MKFEKRSDGGAETPPSQEETPSPGKKPVVIYIMILFIVAFLLMALSFFMHQRSNSEVLGELQDSVSAMQEVQATQEALVDLQSQLDDAEKAIEDLQTAAEETDAQLDAQRQENEALLTLYTLQQQYAAGDFPACQESIQAMESGDLAAALPQEAVEDVVSPAQRYQQLKEAVEARTHSEN